MSVDTARSSASRRLRAWTVMASLGGLLAATPSLGQEIPVGVPMALTGPYAFVGIAVRNGIVLALEEANERGTLAPARLRIIGEDTASDKGQSITLANRLNAVDKVLIMLGPTSSIEGLAAAPVANDLKMPMFTSAVSGDILKAGPWSYKITASPADIMAEFGRFAADRLKLKKTVYVFNRDNDGLVTQKNVFRDVLKAAGGEVVAEEGILGSDTDFVAIQARQAGLSDKVTILAPPSMASQAFIKTGGKAVEGTYLVADYFEGADTPQNKTFVAAFRAKHKAAPDNWAAVGYALGSIAVDVLKIAGPNADRETVRASFGKLGRVPTVLGDGSFEFGPDRAPRYGAAILAVRGGAFVDAGK